MSALGGHRPSRIRDIAAPAETRHDSRVHRRLPPAGSRRLRHRSPAREQAAPPPLPSMSWSQDTSTATAASDQPDGGSSASLPAAISCSLPLVPRCKLSEMRLVSQGANGTVWEARHADWRMPVAVKCIQLHRTLAASDRSSILKEAEILHKARFHFILPIFGMYHDPPFLGFVTEYMTNGSLDQLLLQKDDYPDIPWSLRFRILYEIALGVNFLHNMNPPLLHHDLKTPNILMDSEFHVKIADFGLSKWRSLSSSQSTIDASSTGGGTVVYMPPEEYDLSKKTRASVKHDIYSYAIIMWEVFSRKQPFEDATNAVQIMFNVAKGTRPDISEDSVPRDIPHREMMILLMTSGWAQNPDDRPPFLKCLIDLEPIILESDEIAILEAVLQIKKTKARRTATSNMLLTDQPYCNIPVQEEPVERSNTTPNTLLSHPPYLNILEEPVVNPDRRMSKGDCNISSLTENLTATCVGPCTYTPMNPTSPGDNGGLCSFLSLKPDFLPSSGSFSETIHQGAASRWIEEKREEIVSQMTEACANQCLDALLARSLLMTEDYELIKAKQTRTSKVRQLIDTCKGELFSRVIVQKLKDNRQMGLQPFPDCSLENQSASCHFNSMSTL